MKKFFFLWLFFSAIALPQTITPQVTPESQKVGVQGTAIASASSINIGAATGQTVHITGTTTIASLGVAAPGVQRVLIVDTAVTFTYNSTSLILPGSADLVAGGGDSLWMISLGSGNWFCLSASIGNEVPVAQKAAISIGNGIDTFFPEDGSGSVWGTIVGSWYWDNGSISTSGSGNLTAVSFSGPTIGTVTNDNATAGNVGEYVISTVAVGSAVSLTSGSPLTVTSISLTAGDWDVTGVVDYHPGSLTTGSYFEQGISATTNALGTQDQFSSNPMALVAGLSVDSALPIPVSRISLSSTTTIYLTCKAGFTTSTMGAYGTLRARRIR